MQRESKILGPEYGTGGSKDYESNRDAAERLAAQIRKFWMNAGYAGILAYVVEHFTSNAQGRYTRYRIVSNLNDKGYPPKEAQQQLLAA